MYTSLPAGRRRLQQRPCSVLVWCHCRVQSPAAIVTAVILLGAGWAVPYYVPLPAYNLRKGGSFSAVLEGTVSLLNFQRLPLHEHAIDIKLTHHWVCEDCPANLLECFALHGEYEARLLLSYCVRPGSSHSWHAQLC